MPSKIVKPFFIKLCERWGRYVPFTEAESRMVQREAIPFRGDLPASAGPDRHQRRLEFAVPRAPVEVCDLLYTPGGMSWIAGKLICRFSLREPSVKDLFDKPSPAKSTFLEGATIIQSSVPYTYGDWVAEHLMSLVTNLPLRFPLLLPKLLEGRSYVQRDLAALGIEVIPVNRSVSVKRAVVLPRHVPTNCFHSDDVNAYRRAFKIVPVPPRAGSMLYLSRYGEQSAFTDREYPSEMIAELVNEMGGRVVFTNRTSIDEYRSLAAEAETVLADHGAAMCNLVFWNTQRVIEFFSDSWWTPYYIFYCNALGIADHSLVCIDGINKEKLKAKIAAALSHP